MTKPDPSTEHDDSSEAVGEPANSSSPWNQAAVFRLIGLGTELAGFTLVIAGIGYVIDAIGQFPKPYGTALGALVGFSLGMVRFIQQARKRDDN